MSEIPSALSRRAWLERAALIAAPALVASVVAPDVLGAHSGSAPEPAAPATPRDALAALVAGNARFAAGQSTNTNRTLARLQELGTKQAPFAAVLGCSDSRVPLELLFDQGFGDIFVARVAGNVASSEMIGSLEYSTAVLGSKLVMVLGHSACGAVKATMSGEAVPGQIGSLYPYIHQAVVEAHAGGLDAVVQENVRNQVQVLRNASPVLSERIRSGLVDVVGAMFDFRTGRVTVLDTPPMRTPRVAKDPDEAR